MNNHAGTQSYLQLARLITGNLDDAEADSDRIHPDTIEHAQRLAGIRFTSEEREIMAEGISSQLAMYAARLNGIDLPDSLFPATVFRALLPGRSIKRATSSGDPRTLASVTRDVPTDQQEIAYASIADLSHWLKTRQITSVELAELYLSRLKQMDSSLQCVITLVEKTGLAQAARADAELRAGRWRGPLHGIPWGAKDLLDTKGIPTTWGAATHRHRVADRNAAVVERLDEAGAVLIAKLSLGALAYGDIWFDGKTRNPWNPEEGSSGSSAGSACATAAGLVGFSIGTETCGSIVSPSLRCGTVGLRPTFGRVPRDGAMALCWSLDKIGPITRHVDDTAPILAAINGASDGDPASVSEDLFCDIDAGCGGLRVGYDPRWYEDKEFAIEKNALIAIRDAGAQLVEIDLPDWPWDSLFTILLAEASAAFESITRNDRDDELVWQEPEAWPNTFRQSWLIPAPELIQVDRFRRRCMEHFADLFDTIDAIAAPSFVDGLIISMNCTGNPSLTVPVDLKPSGSPHGITLIGRLFDEGTLLRLGRAIEGKCWLSEPRMPV